MVPEGWREPMGGLESIWRIGDAIMSSVSVEVVEVWMDSVEVVVGLLDVAGGGEATTGTPLEEAER